MFIITPLLNFILMEEMNLNALYYTEHLQGHFLIKPFQKYRQFFADKQAETKGWRYIAVLTAHAVSGIFAYPVLWFLAVQGMQYNFSESKQIFKHNQKQVARLNEVVVAGAMVRKQDFLPEDPYLATSEKIESDDRSNVVFERHANETDYANAVESAQDVIDYFTRHGIMVDFEEIGYAHSREMDLTLWIVQRPLPVTRSKLDLNMYGYIETIFHMNIEVNDAKKSFLNKLGTCFLHAILCMVMTGSLDSLMSELGKANRFKRQSSAIARKLSTWDNLRNDHLTSYTHGFRRLICRQEVTALNVKEMSDGFNLILAKYAAQVRELGLDLTHLDNDTTRVELGFV